MLDKRLALDRVLTSKRYGDLALSATVVEATWEKVLDVPNNEYNNWLRAAGVLVGRLNIREEQSIPQG